MSANGAISRAWALARNFRRVRNALSTLASLHSGDGVQDAMGGLTGEETAALVRWAAEEGRDVVEIGALFGMTTRELARALPEGRRVFAVDNFSWNPFGLPARSHEAFTRRILAPELASGKVVLVNGDSEGFLGSVDPGVFLFLDGDHRYEAVKREIGLALAAGVRVVAGHDYGNALFGVTRAVDEAFGRPDETAGMCWIKRL